MLKNRVLHCIPLVITQQRDGVYNTYALWFDCTLHHLGEAKQPTNVMRIKLLLGVICYKLFRYKLL